MRIRRHTVWPTMLILAAGSCGGSTHTLTVTPPGYEDPCTTDDDCTRGSICVERDFGDPTLVCRKPCDRSEMIDTQCPDEWCAACLAVGDGPTTCYLAGCS